MKEKENLICTVIITILLIVSIIIVSAIEKSVDETKFVTFGLSLVGATSAMGSVVIFKEFTKIIKEIIYNFKILK